MTRVRLPSTDVIQYYEHVSTAIISFHINRTPTPTFTERVGYIRHTVSKCCWPVLGDSKPDKPSPWAAFLASADAQQARTDLVLLLWRFTTEQERESAQSAKGPTYAHRRVLTCYGMWLTRKRSRSAWGTP